MFKLIDQPEFTWPVTVTAPAAEGGQLTSSFSVLWRLLPAGERRELGATEVGTDELLRRSIVSVDGVVNAQDYPVPSSPELVQALIDNPWARRGLIDAYAAALMGVPSKAAEGN